MSEAMNDDSANGSEDADASAVPSRRLVLAMGAVAASSVVTIKPALAQAAGSVMNCEIPVPGPHAAGRHIAQDGSLVPAGTPGAFAPATRALTGEEVKLMMRGGMAPAGMDPNAGQAYLNYIRRLQAGMSGFTCYSSLQMPR